MSGEQRKREPKGFTDRELDIMSVLWREGSGTVAEVREVLGEDVGHVAKQAGTVQRVHRDGRREPAREVGVPLHLDQPVGLAPNQPDGVDAVGPVHRYAPAPGHEPDDLVGRHRSAALRQPDQDVVETLHVHAHVGVAAPVPGPAPGRRRQAIPFSGHIGVAGVVAPQRPREAASHR